MEVRVWYYPAINSVFALVTVAILSGIFSPVAQMTRERPVQEDGCKVRCKHVNSYSLTCGYFFAIGLQIHVPWMNKFASTNVMGGRRLDVGDFIKENCEVQLRPIHNSVICPLETYDNEGSLGLCLPLIEIGIDDSITCLNF